MKEEGGKTLYNIVMEYRGKETDGHHKNDTY